MTQQTTTDDTTRRVQPPRDPAVSVVADPDVLTTALDALGAIVDECVLAVGEDGVSVEAMDPATVAMVSLDLDADAFDAFDVDTDRRLGVPLERLRDVVGIADAGQPVELAFDAETRHLHVQVGELAYSLALVDPEAIRSPPDRVDLADQYASSATLDGASLARAVDAADMVADHLALGAEDDHLHVRADGDTDSVEIEFPAADCAALDAPEPVESLFSLQYLASVTSATPGDRPVDLRFGDEAPIEAAFDVADGDGRVAFVVSPRMTRA
ncbi:DNA polymerase sliding clamp [Halobacterium jilantaiense]|uniref:DNA polymerase sliding clamp n=1 Tax=Halobacterium jilantaiense TaxID=355548 RepID=A0A1I0PZR2_9EURY|nr:DNA polymerase sliding clamp [Halobacterium jilantaiense]SEW19973.1 monomeric archaeal DNA polymerase sliding clamp [Halobacterium jilantaiense]